MRPLIQALWVALLAVLGGYVGGVGGKDDLSAATIILLSLAFVIVIGYWLLTDRPAVTRWPWLSRLPGAVPVPRLRLDEPLREPSFVQEAPASGPRGLGVAPFEAIYVKVPITNEKTAPVAAEDVQGWLEFRTPSGELIEGEVQARWAHTEQAPDRSEFAPVDDPALNEVRIPAGSTRHLDVVASADEFQGFRMWTNPSMRVLAAPEYVLGDREILATLTVRGSNTAEHSVTLRLSRSTGSVDVAVEA